MQSSNNQEHCEDEDVLVQALIESLDEINHPKQEFPELVPGKGWVMRKPLYPR